VIPSGPSGSLEGLDGLADGEHVFDVLAEDVVAEFVVTVPAGSAETAAALARSAVGVRLAASSGPRAGLVGGGFDAGLGGAAGDDA
jgi:hypothetical protein